MVSPSSRTDTCACTYTNLCIHNNVHTHGWSSVIVPTFRDAIFFIIIVVAVMQMICLQLDPRDDMITVQEKLSERWNSWNHNNMYMVANGKVLDSFGTLQDYGLSEGSLVDVSRRQRGGCFVVSFSILIVMFVSLLFSFCTCGVSLAIIPILMPFLFILPLFCL